MRRGQVGADRYTCTSYIVGQAKELNAVLPRELGASLPSGSSDVSVCWPVGFISLCLFLNDKCCYLLSHRVLNCVCAFQTVHHAPSPRRWGISAGLLLRVGLGDKCLSEYSVLTHKRRLSSPTEANGGSQCGDGERVEFSVDAAGGSWAGVLLVSQICYSAAAAQHRTHASVPAARGLTPSGRVLRRYPTNERPCARLDSATPHFIEPHCLSLTLRSTENVFAALTRSRVRARVD